MIATRPRNAALFQSRATLRTGLTWFGKHGATAYHNLMPTTTLLAQLTPHMPFLSRFLDFHMALTA
jgi:hypothetical protein